MKRTHAIKMLQSDEDEIEGHVVLELRSSHGNVWVASVGQCPVSTLRWVGQQSQARSSINTRCWPGAAVPPRVVTAPVMRSLEPVLRNKSGTVAARLYHSALFTFHPLHLPRPLTT